MKPANAKIIRGDGTDLVIVELDCASGEEGRRCHVPARPGPKQRDAWHWNGDEEAPTLFPVLNCGGCGFRGALRDGALHASPTSKVKL